jgi:hypothetical protein
MQRLDGERHARCARMAEDRGIEPYARLQTLAAQDEIYAGLLNLCRQADAKYNSGLFDFSAKGNKKFTSAKMLAYALDQVPLVAPAA